MSAADIIGITASTLHALHRLYQAGRSIKEASSEPRELLRETDFVKELLVKIQACPIPASGDTTSIFSGPSHSGSKLRSSLAERAERLGKDVEAFLTKTTKVGKDGSTREVKKLRWMFHPSETTEMAKKIREFH